MCIYTYLADKRSLSLLLVSMDHRDGFLYVCVPSPRVQTQLQRLFKPGTCHIRTSAEPCSWVYGMPEIRARVWGIG